MLSVGGFKPSTTYTLRILGAEQPDGTYDECVGKCTKTFRTNKVGRAEVPKAAAGFVGQEIRVEVDGLTATAVVRY